MKSFDDLHPYFQARADRDKFSGVVLVTQDAGTLWSGAYGYASRAWQVSNSLGTRFDTASITKLFTAVATLQLIDQGQLAFDTGVIDRLGLRDTTISRDVSVVILANMEDGAWEPIWEIHKRVVIE